MRNGFTLAELLIYSVIFAIIAIILVYFLTLFFQISGRQIGSTEVANQANFILQKIQQEIANASSTLVVVNNTGDDEQDAMPLGIPRNRLIIKQGAETTGPPNDTQSPISIYKNGTNVILKKGSQDEIILNNAAVHVTNLSFSKVSTPPGRDIVLIDLSLQYVSTNPQQQLTRRFTLGVSRATAATFDTPLNPGATNSLDIGTGTLKWKSAFLSGDLNLDGKIVWNAAGSNNSITFMKQGSLAINPPSIGSGNSSIITINSSTTPALLGVQSGDRVLITPPSNLEDGLLFIGASATTDALSIKIRNITNGAIDGANLTWSYFIVR